MAHKEKENSLAKVGVQGRIGGWLYFENLKKEGIEASHKLIAKLLCELAARRKSRGKLAAAMRQPHGRIIEYAAGSRRRHGRLAATQEARGNNKVRTRLAHRKDTVSSRQETKIAASVIPQRDNVVASGG